MSEGALAGLSTLTILGFTGIPLLLLLVSLVAGIYAAYLGWNYGGGSHWPKWAHALLGFIFNWFYLAWYYLVRNKSSFTII